MRGIVAVAKRVVTAVASVVIAVFLCGTSAQAQSTIQAQLCHASQVTITQPAHDGTVNNSVIHFTGTVSDAGQIEVYVDNGYSTQIPLANGQTSYASDISIGTGTHTIKLVAVGSCSDVPNGQATLVATYEPAKASGPTSTNISENGSKVDSSNNLNGQQQSPLSPSLNNTLQSIAQWMNFKIDSQQQSQSRLSFVRGITFAAGLILTVFGMSLVVVDWFSQITAGFLLPFLTGSKRLQVFRIFFRAVGVVVILLTLFV